MRTADRLASRQWAFPLGLEENKPFMEDAADHVRGHLPVEGGRGPIIVADNVARYVEDRGAPCLEDYPSLAPPWQSFWIEYPSSGQQRRGVWVLDTTEHMDRPLHELKGDDRDHLQQMAAQAKHHALTVNGAEPGSVKWVVALVLFLEQDRSVWGPVGIMSLALDEGGQVLGNRWSMNPVTVLAEAAHARLQVPRPSIDHGEEIEIPTRADIKAMPKPEQKALIDSIEGRISHLHSALTQHEERRAFVSESIDALERVIGLGAEQTEDELWLLRALAPALQAVAFLHCKNVVLDEQVPSDKVQAKRRKRGHDPILRWHTIRLDVPRKQSGGDRKSDLGAPSLHIVAGHFAHYGACCPSHEPHGLLFGRLSGVYWVPSHVRGDRTVGEVRTDMELNEVLA